MVAGVAKVVVLNLVCLVSWVCCLVLFWCVWLVWWVCFFWLFFSLLEKDPMLVVFFQFCFLFFMVFGSSEVTFSVILVSLGRLWTRLVPGGVQGGDLVEIVRSSGALLAPFWSHFWSKTVMFLRCFLRCLFECFFNGF